MPDAFPVVDPETGEVLAMDADERREVASLAAADLVDAERRLEAAREAAAAARRKLAALMVPGDAVAMGGGWAVTCKPGAPARRAINKQALQERAEDLEPLGLAPREVVKVEFPGVAALTTTAARASLARLGLTPETFLLSGEPGEPQVVVVRPEAAS